MVNDQKKTIHRSSQSPENVEESWSSTPPSGPRRVVQRSTASSVTEKRSAAAPTAANDEGSDEEDEARLKRLGNLPWPPKSVPPEADNDEKPTGYFLYPRGLEKSAMATTTRGQRPPQPSTPVVLAPSHHGTQEARFGGRGTNLLQFGLICRNRNGIDLLGRNAKNADPQHLGATTMPPKRSTRQNSVANSHAEAESQGHSHAMGETHAQGGGQTHGGENPFGGGQTHGGEQVLGGGEIPVGGPQQMTLMFEMIKAMQQNQAELAESLKQLREANTNKEDHQNKNDNRNHEERESHNKNDTPFVTMSDVADLLKQERERAPKEPRHFVRRPPYPIELLKEPYPEKYDTPVFALFDGRRGSAMEHISKFLDSMGPFAANGDLCLREFSKSLVDRAYTWYTVLPAGSIRTWEDMVESFCSKYFHVEEKITLVNLHSTKQQIGEDLVKYIHRFRDVSLDCHVKYQEGELVEVCIDNMLPEFRAHLENLDITRFAPLLQKARKTAISVKPQVEKSRDKKSLPQTLTVSTATAPSDQVIKLPKISKQPTPEEQKDPKYCRYHRYVNHSTVDCRTLRWEVNRKIQNGTLLLSEAQQKVHQTPFPNYNKDKGKAVVSVVIHGNVSDVEAEESAAASSSLVPAAVRTLQRSPKFKSLFNQLGFGPEARNAANRSTHYNSGRIRSHLFYSRSSCQPRALVDTGSCLNLIPLSTLQAVDLPHQKIQGSPMEVTGFGDLGCTSTNLVSSTYHQCVKGRLNGKPIRIAANSCPFDQTEAHFVEAALYDDLASTGEPSIVRPCGTPLPAWEDIKDDPEIDLRELLQRKKKRKERAWGLTAHGKRVPHLKRVVCSPHVHLIQQTENSGKVVVDQLQSTTMDSEEITVDHARSMVMNPKIVAVDQTRSIAANTEKAVKDQAESTTTNPEGSTGGSFTVHEELEVIDLSDNPDITKPVSISKSLSAKERKCLIDLLHEYKDVFAWDYHEMPGIDPGASGSFFECGARYQTCGAAHENLPYGNFRNLNKACPKDEFPLPNMDLLIDSAAGHAMFSFMDGFSGYNQIRMSTRDAEKTAFRTPIGNFYYTVMPFGLKNAGATYQRTMTAMFHDMMHKEIEDYVDDIVVKSKKREDHLGILRKVFDRCRLYKLKMNPLKCAFGVSAGKFLGFLVHNRGIDVDPAKASAIATMKAPTSHKELKSFLGRLSYIRRFIPGLAAVTAVFAPLMKKGVPFIWSTACQQAFEKIQQIMTKLPTVCAPVPGRPLRLYLASNSEAIGGLVAQEDEEGTERPIYYVSRALKDAETRYSGAELKQDTRGLRACLALIYASQRLRHYFLAHKIQLITKSHPIRSLLHRPRSRSQAIADLLAQFPGEDSSSISHEVPGEIGEALLADLADSTWTLKFDGSSTSSSSGAGIVLAREDGKTIAKSFKLDFPCSNNASEYEAYITGLVIAHEMGIKHLRVIGGLQSYHLPDQGCENRYADALATLGSQVSFEGSKVDVTIKEDWRTPIKAKLVAPEGVADLKVLKDYVLIAGDLYRRLPGGVLARCVNLQEAAKKLTEVHEKCCELRDGISLYRRLQRLGYFWPSMSKEAASLQEQCSFCQHQHESDQIYATFVSSDWRTPFLEYLIENILPQTSQAAVRIKKLATRYFVEGGILFRKGFHGDPLRCLSLAESQTVMKEAHSGECGEHQGKKRLYQLLLTLGYYWPTMKKDTADFVKSCHTCQLQANLIHTHPTSLQNMATPWPFHTWGLDLIGPINPASGGYIWILVATEYFSKWVEAIPLRKATGAAVANFIREHIITRFGIPHKIISDNGTPFVNKNVREVLEHYRIKHRRSTPYYPQGNGQAEATNRMLLRILSKMVFDYGKGWSSHLADTLWAYRGSTKTATGFTPFSLVYGTDAISPTELLVPSPRILHGMDLEADADICAEARVADLEGLETRIFAKGQMVLKTVDHVRRGLPSPSKFAPNWEGPYLIREAYDSGYYKLSTADGTTLADPINGKWLKRYYS
uniref:Integrase catalytic domain-containing protein n=1 Tax=Fagus sylvatica TaxID=28930 RepID=A0A2N9GU17_FAGSY